MSVERDHVEADRKLSWAREVHGKIGQVRDERCRMSLHDALDRGVRIDLRRWLHERAALEESNQFIKVAEPREMSPSMPW